ncbi:MAG: Rrf2 family transcriptional regulator [Pseudomonadota bacterium]
MKIGKGVEWSAHTCALLALLPEGAALSGEALAEFLGLQPTYLAKQLQAMSRAGIVKAKRGVAGGYRLARPAEDISLWEITAAVEGAMPLFRCTEVRRAGPCGAAASECKHPCAIAAAFRTAESGYREALSTVRLPQIVSEIAADAAPARKRRITRWVEQNAALAV